MIVSLQYQYMLDMEREKSQTALFKCYDFREAKIILTVYGDLKVRITLWFAILYRCAKVN